MAQLLISEQAMTQVESLVCAQPVGPLQLKGFAQGILAYEVTGLKKKASDRGERISTSIPLDHPEKVRIASIDRQVVPRCPIRSRLITIRFGAILDLAAQVGSLVPRQSF